MDKKEVQVNLEPVANEFLENADLNVEAFKGKILNVVREKAPEEYANFSQQMEAMTGFIKDVYLLSFHTFLSMLKKKALKQVNGGNQVTNKNREQMKTNNLLTTIFGKKVERDENGRMTIEGKTLTEAFREHMVNLSNRKKLVNVNKEDKAK